MPFSIRLCVLAAILTGAACGSSPTATPADTFGGSATATSVDVSMPGSRYAPNHIDIAQGGVVQFIFPAEAHDVRFNNAAGAPSDVLAATNSTVARTFANKGTFPFLCTLHDNMTGTVIVH